MPRVARGVVRRWHVGRGVGAVVEFSARIERAVVLDDLVDLARLRPGQVVLFEPVDDDDGPRAIAVRPFERVGTVAVADPPRHLQRGDARWSR
jgi:hypothetical protein